MCTTCLKRLGISANDGKYKKELEGKARNNVLNGFRDKECLSGPLSKLNKAKERISKCKDRSIEIT